MITTRRATEEDMARWYGQKPRWTLRAARLWEADGAPCAIAGYYVDRCRAVVFCEIRLPPEEVCRHARAVLKGARALLAEVRAVGLPACAIADPAWPRAERLLERLGFARLGEVWVRP